MKKSTKNTLILLMTALSIVSVIYIKKTESTLTQTDNRELIESEEHNAIGSLKSATAIVDKISRVLLNDYLEL